MKSFGKRILLTGLLTIAAAIMSFMPISEVTADDVVLNPGYIEGNVSVGAVSLSRIYIYASGCDGNTASTNVYNKSNYSLTVNTPENGSCEYTVQCTAYSDNDNDRLYFSNKAVTVSDGGTSILNFSVTPGYVTGTVTVENATVSYGYVYASLSSGSNSTNARTQFSSDGEFSFPVQPNDSIRLYGYVYTNDGTQYKLDNKYISVAANSTVTQDWTLSPGTGSITGNCTINGVADVDRWYIYGYGPNSTYKNTYADTNGDYTLSDLIAGDWNTNIQIYMNDYDDYFAVPYSQYTRTVTVPSGETIVNDLNTDACFINGQISLTGSKGIQDVSSGQIYCYGIYDTSTYGGNSQDRINPDTGDFDLIVTEGDWEIYYTRLNFYNSDQNDYLNAYLYFYDYTNEEVSVLPGTPVDNYDIDLGTGIVSINFSVEGGGVFSQPRLNGYCYVRDSNDQTLSYSYMRAYGPTAETTHESVTFVGTPGIYDITAEALVDGSLATFGQLEIEVVKGTDIITDIGAPTLSVTSPEPDLYTTASDLTASGTATDDTGVAGVTVNGVEASISSTGNQDDENEISYSADVSLDFGPNMIQTVATDTTGKSITDKRTVYRDSEAPELDWTPEDGTTTYNSTVSVEGTATDDNEISKITVNGNDVTFSSTNNPNDSNEVSFSTTVSISEGDNQIVVAATDNCKRTTSQTHTITLGEACEQVDDLFAASKSAKVQIVWSHTGADSYNIYRKTDGDYALLANTTSTYSTYLDLDVVNGTTYFYFVKSVCNDQESDASNEVSATPSRRRR